VLKRRGTSDWEARKKKTDNVPSIASVAKKAKRSFSNGRRAIEKGGMGQDDEGRHYEQGPAQRKQASGRSVCQQSNV